MTGLIEHGIFQSNCIANYLYFGSKSCFAQLAFKLILQTMTLGHIWKITFKLQPIKVGTKMSPGQTGPWPGQILLQQMGPFTI